VDLHALYVDDAEELLYIIFNYIFCHMDSFKIEIITGKG